MLLFALLSYEAGDCTFTVKINNRQGQFCVIVAGS